MILWQLRQLIVVPVLETLGPPLNSKAAVELLLGTAAVESDLQAIRQIIVTNQWVSHGTARSPWMIEPATESDIWFNFLRFRSELAERVKKLMIPDMADQMPGNLWYSCAMARMVYYRRPEPLPLQGDVKGQAKAWKAWYNTPKGKGTVQDYLDKHSRYVSPD